MSTSERHRELGIVGLGLMGTALAERFLEAGYRVRVWNRSPAKAEPLLRLGAVWSDCPPRDCDRVVVSLYTTEVVAEVLELLGGAWRPGLVVIDTTTGDPTQVVALAQRLSARGVPYLDAPISGSSVQTRRGEATVMVGGERAVFDQCADLWALMGAKVIHCGPVGSASRMKLISNLVLGLNRAALAEGLAFAEAIGVDAGAALEVLTASMAYSRAMDVKGRKMVDRDFSVQARLSQHLKDVRIILQAAAEAGLELPLAGVHRRLMEQAEAAGLGDLDNSVVIEVLRRAAEPRPGP